MAATQIEVGKIVATKTSGRSAPRDADRTAIHGDRSRNNFECFGDAGDGEAMAPMSRAPARWSRCRRSRSIGPDRAQEARRAPAYKSPDASPHEIMTRMWSAGLKRAATSWKITSTVLNRSGDRRVDLGRSPRSKVNVPRLIAAEGDLHAVHHSRRTLRQPIGRPVHAT
jgi:hypothetical protein